jgi:hypothetical protein
MNDDALLAEWLTEVSAISGAQLAPHIFWVSVIVSFVALAVFRRRVRRSLERVGQGPDTAHDQASAATDAETGRPRSVAAPPEWRAADSESRWPTLLTEAVGRRRHLAKLYMFAGLGLAIAFAAIRPITTADPSPAPILGFLYAAICFSTPLILVARAVYGRWVPWLVRVAVGVPLLAVTSQALPFANEADGALLTVALLALLLHPRVRAMGPLALGFFSIVFVGSAVATVSFLYMWIAELRTDVQAMTALASLQTMDAAQRAEAVASIWQEFLPRILRVVGAGAAIGLFVSVLLGGLLLRRVTSSYTRKRTSDQWLVIASIWLFFSFAVASSLASLVANLACAAIFVVVVRSLWSRLPRPDGCSRLLLLRSFTLGERSNRLFQELETLWRGVGSIQLVGAPDLAGSTLEPHELLDFLRGRSGRYFARSQSDVDRRLASFDYVADPDGRFRVNEIFCVGDATWQHAVRRLLAESHCVLMDARGVTRYRAGCAFEIGCLATSTAASRVVFLVDGASDRGFIGEIWANAAGSSSAAARSQASALAFVSDNPDPDHVCERIIAAFSVAPAAAPVPT